MASRSGLTWAPRILCLDGQTNRRRVARGFAAMAAFALTATVMGLDPLPARAAGDNPIASLVGNWSGNGKAILDTGKTEAMRCKAYYTGQGNNGLGIAIRCANASANIDLRATLTFANGAVSGNWEERTYNAAGSVSGKFSTDKVDLAITGGGLTAAMAVSISGANHSVSISTQGTGLKGVNISLSRG
jgi:hypothetical protein